MDATVALRACHLFKGFTETGLQIVKGVANKRLFPKGTPLFVEGMVADALFVIGEGTVRLTSKSRNGDEIPVGELGPGDYLGELSLITQGQRLCTATAVSAVTAFEIRHADFQRLLTTKPQACVKLLMGVVALFGQKVAANKDALKSLLTR